MNHTQKPQQIATINTWTRKQTTSRSTDMQSYLNSRQKQQIQTLDRNFSTKNVGHFKLIIHRKNLDAFIRLNAVELGVEFRPKTKMSSFL
jgi:flavin-dependent dehydrogenase